jgi:hypothetical protein
MPLLQPWGWYEYAATGEGTSPAPVVEPWRGGREEDPPSGPPSQPLRALALAAYQRQVLKHVMPDMESYPGGPLTSEALSSWIGQQYRSAPQAAQPLQGQLLSRVGALGRCLTACRRPGLRPRAAHTASHPACAPSQPCTKQASLVQPRPSHLGQPSRARRSPCPARPPPVARRRLPATAPCRSSSTWRPAAARPTATACAWRPPAATAAPARAPAAAAAAAPSTCSPTACG